MSSEDLLTDAKKSLTGYQNAREQLVSALEQVESAINELTVMRSEIQAELHGASGATVPVEAASGEAPVEKPKRQRKRQAKAPAAVVEEPTVEVEATPTVEDELDDWEPGEEEPATPAVTPPSKAGDLDSLDNIEF